MRKVNVLPGQLPLPLPRLDPAIVVDHLSIPGLPDLSTGPRRLLRTLVQHMTPDGVCASPKAAIQAAAGIPERTARRYLRELERYQLIVSADQPRTKGMFGPSAVRASEPLRLILGMAA